MVDPKRSVRFSGFSKGRKEAQFRSSWSIILCRLLRVRIPGCKIYSYGVYGVVGSVVDRYRNSADVSALLTSSSKVHWIIDHFRSSSLTFGKSYRRYQHCRPRASALNSLAAFVANFKSPTHPLLASVWQPSGQAESEGGTYNA